VKILCAVDFGARTQPTVRVARDLARRTSGTVELVHVVPLRVTGEAVDAAVLDDTVREDGRTRLEALGREVAAAGVPVTMHLAEGDVEREVMELAKAAGADLVIMGAHGRPALERLVLGSASERTVRIADRPVLIVPPGVEPSNTPGGKEVDRPLRISVALDGRLASDGALEFVRGLRRHTACDVTILRLYWPLEEIARLGLRGTRDLFAPDPDIVADLERTLRLQVGALPGKGTTRFSVQPAWGEPAERLLSAADLASADLLVMGAESRHGLARVANPPVAERVARHARHVPVVFAPKPARASAGARAPRGIFTVLAATDLSPSGNRAVPYAYEMLAGHGGVVELCTVHEHSVPSPAYAYDSSRGDLSAERRAEIEIALRALVPPEAEALGISTHVRVIDGGKAATDIVQAAERLAVDAIVVGAHGRGRALRSLLGSVSSGVVGTSQRPVLVIPSRDDG
jgi:nucleotide-binding universal stress UspA family protein